MAPNRRICPTVRMIFIFVTLQRTNPSNSSAIAVIIRDKCQKSNEESFINKKGMRGIAQKIINEKSVIILCINGFSLRLSGN